MASETISTHSHHHKPTSWNKDRNAIFLLFLFYFIQALPQGFFSATIPLTLMEKGATYDDLMIIFLSYIPFCFKCFLSPILNTYYLKSFGKGKTYLVPAYYILGLTMLLLAYKGEALFQKESIPFLGIISVFMMCTLTISDISLDGWMVSFLSKENSSYGAVCQTVGFNVGFFLSFNLFVPLNSLDFCNTFIYSTPRDTPILEARPYIAALATFILLVAFSVHMFLVEKEKESHKPTSAIEILKTLSIFVSNNHFRKLFFLFTTWNLIFGPVHNLFTTLMLQKGVSKELITNLNTPIPGILFVFSMWMGGLCKKFPETKIINTFWLIRLLAAFILYGTIVYFDLIPESAKIPLLFLCLLLGAITFTAIGIAMGAFSSRVAQETYGGPILSTFGAIGNLGRLVADMFSLFSLKYITWDNLAIASLVGMQFYAILFVRGLSWFEKRNFKHLVEKAKHE